MYSYDTLLDECNDLEIEVYEMDNMKSKGLYGDNVIWINKSLPSISEKCCILAEEVGHHHTTTGDILDLSSVENRKQELKARAWAYERLIPFSKIIQAHKLHITNRYELSEFLNVTEDFLDDALDWYKSKFGLYVSIDNFTICFEPLGVLEWFEWIETPKLKYQA
ncbi:ImmA/IrrE family metallo-endopeptidase [Lysinibacillus xylanilyticus]|uniref:ImmA/IrrE family metallo-endopeptidase n=1 Tax=Lysinibacillus xylanilyticus TaxID=582475 RepID=A0ABT4ENS4_9BACI|nr:ImmA/IrrE family metallo-endopeptidase [Lysinibacillus xylanilyticus]MCY9547312.1 ImmA/IrrE family metallo-endopeptidase [Lysinibacillus xylanilyticus]